MKYNSLIKRQLLQSYILYTNSTQQLKLSSLNNKNSFAEHSPSTASKLLLPPLSSM